MGYMLHAQFGPNPTACFTASRATWPEGAGSLTGHYEPWHRAYSFYSDRTLPSIFFLCCDVIAAAAPTSPHLNKLCYN